LGAKFRIQINYACLTSKSDFFYYLGLFPWYIPQEQGNICFRILLILERALSKSFPIFKLPLRHFHNLDPNRCLVCLIILVRLWRSHTLRTILTAVCTTASTFWSEVWFDWRSLGRIGHLVKWKSAAAAFDAGKFLLACFLNDSVTVQRDQMWDISGCADETFVESCIFEIHLFSGDMIPLAVISLWTVTALGVQQLLAIFWKTKD
jgi:hypothetical protein